MSLSDDQFEILHQICVEGEGEAMCHVPFSDDIGELINREFVCAYVDDDLAYLVITGAGLRALAS